MVLAVCIPVVFLLAVLERIHPLRPEWNRNTGDLKVDIAAIVLIMGVVNTVLEASVQGILPNLRAAIGTIGWVESMGVFAQAIVAILFVDCVKYWYHRASHRFSFLWYIHSCHHAVKRMYLLNSYRAHPLYFLATYALGVFVLHSIGFHPDALRLAVVVDMIMAAFEHANLKYKVGSLVYIFNVNELHRWHHSQALEDANANYGADLSIWDWMFGTLHYRPDEREGELGIDYEDTYPMTDYGKQLIVPFRWKQMVERPADTTAE